MKWPLSSRNKRRIAALLAFVFLIVLMRHFTGKQHVSEMGESFSSVYKDRLVVEGYIYELSTHFHKKEVMVDNCKPSDAVRIIPKVHEQNDIIQGLIADYEQTKLTREEARGLQKLKENLSRLFSLETSYLNNVRYDNLVSKNRSPLKMAFREIDQDLKQLSLIQLEVGRQMNEESQRKMSQANMFSNVDLSALIVIALVIQAILFSTRTTVIRKPVKFWLN